jgi:hypothetical protein
MCAQSCALSIAGSHPGRSSCSAVLACWPEALLVSAPKTEAGSHWVFQPHQQVAVNSKVLHTNAVNGPNLVFRPPTAFARYNYLLCLLAPSNSSFERSSLLQKQKLFQVL